MNALLAAALFVVVCLAGIRFPAPVVGGTLPGSPAQEAEIHWPAAGRGGAASSPAATRQTSSFQDLSTGFKPGDRILSVNGRRITQFGQIAAIAALAEPNQDFGMIIGREFKDGVQKGYIRIGVMPLEGHLGFGLMPAMSTTFGSLQDYLADDPFAARGRHHGICRQAPAHHEGFSRHQPQDRRGGRDHRGRT